MDIYAESAPGNTETLPYGDATFQVVDDAQGGVIAYCHAENAGRIVAALKARDDRVTPASTLGTLIGALGACDPDATVLLDYQGELAQPGKPTYYRGYHNELALTPDGTEPTTVAELLDTLRDIRIYGFTRPGRETEAPDTTGIWVAQHRVPSGLHVIGVRVDGGTVIIVTEDRA